MRKNSIQEPGMSKFYSPDFGFLHACKKDGKVWFNMTDVCRCLNVKLGEADGWMKDSDCEVREYNVKRAKITTCNRYVDGDGLSSILIYCCRGIANSYRRWINNVILYSFLNPEKSQAIKELDDETCNHLTSPQIVDHYKAMATKKERAKVIENSKTKEKEPVSTTGKTPFIPKDGHMMIEEWFREEFPIMEFLGIIDGLVEDALSAIAVFKDEKKWPAQHRVNVMKVFRSMLLANEGNIKYAPSETRKAMQRVS